MLDAGFVSEEPIPKLGVIPMGIKQRVSPIRLGNITLRNRTLHPPVIRLTSKVQDPARHRHGNPVSGELSNERVHHFPGR